MLKKVLSYICLLGLSLFLAGCSSSGSISTFSIGVEKFPSNFDPQIATEKSDILVLTNVFDGLFEKVNGSVQKNLVEDYTISPDGKTYTMKLKQTSVYNYTDSKTAAFDKTPVTAKDFVFALQRVLDPNTHSPYIDYFSNIKNATRVKSGEPVSILGLSAPDDYTLIIQLENPDYNFAEKLCSTAAFPCNESFFFNAKGSYGLSVKNLLSNGPFKLNYLDEAGENATIVRTDDKAKNVVQRIRIKKIPSQEQTASFSEEAISGFFSFTGSKENYSNATELKFDSANISLTFNLARPQLANASLRKSLAYYAYGFQNSGANLQAVNPATSIFPDTITLAGSPLSQSLAAYSPVYMGQDPKALLSQALGELGVQKLEPFTVLMPNDSIYTIIFENINQLWQKNLGQYFSIEYLSTSQIESRIAKGDYDIAFLPLTPKNDTPYGILEHGAGYNETLAGLLASATAMSDQSKALPLIAKCEQIILDEAILVPMGKEATIFYYQKYFSNVYIDPFNYVVNLKYAKAN